MENIVLGNVTGWLKENKLDKPYRAILTKDIDEHSDYNGKYVIKIEEYFEKDDQWIGTGGSWFASTLIEGGTNDKLFIDYGQDWYVTGMVDILDKALQDHI